MGWRVSVNVKSDGRLTCLQYIFTLVYTLRTTSVQMKRPALLHISIILLLDGRHNAMTVYA
jgi:hypothetical protein